MKVCSQCGADNREAALICRMCTQPLTEPIQEEVPSITEAPAFASTIIAPVECGRCATLNDRHFNFCQKCGNRLDKDGPLKGAQTVIAGAAPQAPRAFDTDPYTAAPATNAMLQCSSCMNEVAPGSRFCNLCGTPLGEARPGPAAAPTFRLRLIVDGEESDEVYPLDQTTVIGRVQGDILFPYDDYMSARHASITRQGEQFFLKDDGSRNGTLIKIEGETELKPGAVFMVGRQLFKFESDE